MATKENTYSESSISVLKGLEPVKQRPGMYTRTEHPLHIIQEVIDNAADEAIAHHCDTISVKLHSDGSISVSDNGRGIPVGLHPTEGVSTVQVVFTMLHAGGKFNKKDGAGAYSFSGGLHGVGVSVTNALSTRLDVDVVRDGYRHHISFAGGDVAEPLKRVEKATGSGTFVRAWPDAKYFDSPTIPVHELERILRTKAVLMPGVTVNLTFEKTEETKTWLYKSGMQEYLAEQNADSVMTSSLICGERYAEEGHDSFSAGEGASWALAWVEEGSVHRESFVNLIPTPSGGTHEAGLKDALFSAVKSFAEHHSMLPKGVKLAPEDVFGRVSFILSAKLLDPQFQGQTKERLNSREAVKIVSTQAKDPMDLWLSQHVDEGKKITELSIRCAQTRMRHGQKIEKKKGSGVAVLPGKLTDCESEDINKNELFLVEGDSAGGSAKLGRDKENQALLPLRGKVLNTWEIEADKIFGNREVHDIAVALGIEPHVASTTEPVLSGLRYGKCIVMADADVDGSHIQTLLISLFVKHFPKFVSEGHLYIAQPPLYRVDVPAKGKRPMRKIYCLDEGERDNQLDKLYREGYVEANLSISRFKGLGEMSAEQLWDTTMNPDTRRLVKMSADFSTQSGLIDTMDKLMSKGASQSRRALIEINGNLVEDES